MKRKMPQKDSKEIGTEENTIAADEQPKYVPDEETTKQKRSLKSVIIKAFTGEWPSEEREQQPLLTKDFIKLYVSVSIIGFGYNFVTSAEYANFKEILVEAGLTSQSLIGTLLATILAALCIGAMLGGAINDLLRTKFGQRAPSIFLGGIVAAFLFLVVPLVTELTNNPTTIFVLLMIILSINHIAIGAMLAPWLALVADLFKKEERAWAGLSINVFSAGGATIALLVFGTLIENGLHWIIWIITGSALAFSVIITVILVPKENPPYELEGKVRDVWKIPKIIIKYGGRTWPLILLVNTLWSAGSHLVEIGAIDSLVERFGVDNRIASSAYLLMGIFSILLLFPVMKLIDKMGKVFASIVASLVYGAFCFCLGIITKFYWFYLVAVLGGVGNLLISTLQIAMPADVVPRGREASFMGVFFVFGTFIKPIVTLMQGVLLDIGGRDNLYLSTFGGYPWIFVFAGIMCTIAIVLLAYVNYERLIGEEYARFRNRLLIATRERKNKRIERKAVRKRYKKKKQISEHEDSSTEATGYYVKK